MKTGISLGLIGLILAGTLVGVLMTSRVHVPEPQPPELPWLVSKADEVQIDDVGVEFTVDPDTANDEIVKATMTNNREEPIFFGAEYRLQVEIMEEWWDIEVEALNFIAILYSVNPNDTLDMEFQLRPYYGTPPDGELVSGPFRLIKKVYLSEPGPDEEPEAAWVVAEFFNEG